MTSTLLAVLALAALLAAADAGAQQARQDMGQGGATRQQMSRDTQRQDRMMQGQMGPGQMEQGRMMQGQMGPGQMAQDRTASPGAAVRAEHPQIKVFQTPQGIEYLSGGVGEGERERLMQLRSEYGLFTELALASGKYISGVPVIITDADDRIVLQTVMDGPWLFADLPPGKYTVSASYNNYRKQREVSVPAQGTANAMITWAVQEEERLAAGPPAPPGREGMPVLEPRAGEVAGRVPFIEGGQVPEYRYHEVFRGTVPREYFEEQGRMDQGATQGYGRMDQGAAMDQGYGRMDQGAAMDQGYGRVDQGAAQGRITPEDPGLRMEQRAGTYAVPHQGDIWVGRDEYTEFYSGPQPRDEGPYGPDMTDQPYASRVPPYGQQGYVGPERGRAGGQGYWEEPGR